ncbi:MAG: alanyl-tRNA editing protein [Clostridia bacterium]|nr:alanyl-tRNA editing protein [Clostridia bacterium]
MTELLYLQDAYLRENEAVVLEVTEKAIVVDRTCFFPEGGGQPGDPGTINDVKIKDVKLENGVALHIYEGARPAFAPGDRVVCRIDWDARFARMQAHGAEHIVSGLAYSRFGCANVGFHMDPDGLMAVDFDVFLSDEQLSSIEYEANACVWRDHAIIAKIYSNAEAANVFYRSKLEFLEDPRIVTIENVDSCACCAPHLSSTGQIGVIKILSSMRHRGGVRLTLAAGKGAYLDYALKHAIAASVGQALAVRPTETEAAVFALIDRNKELSYEKNAQLTRLLTYMKDETPLSDAHLVRFLPSLNVEELKTAVMIFREKTNGVCVVLSGDDEQGYYFAMSSVRYDVKTFSREVTSALNGSGGGRYDVVQGRLKADRETIERFFRDFEVTEK